MNEYFKWYAWRSILPFLVTTAAGAACLLLEQALISIIAYFSGEPCVFAYVVPGLNHAPLWILVLAVQLIASALALFNSRSVAIEFGRGGRAGDGFLSAPLPLFRLVAVIIVSCAGFPVIFYLGIGNLFLPIGP